MKDVKLFWNGLVHKFCRLKGLITLEQVNTFDGEAINWSGVVNFHGMQMHLVMSIQFIFRDD